MNANFSFEHYIWTIWIPTIHLIFFHFHSFVISIWPSFKHKCCLQRDAVKAIANLKWAMSSLNLIPCQNKQGWIHSYSSRMQEGRGHIWAHKTIWAGAVRSKCRIHKKVKCEWQTDRQTDRQKDRPTEPGVESRGTRLKNKARYTATPIVCGWAGAIFEVTRPFGQEQ